MSKHVKHVPKHRNAPARTISAQVPKRAIRTTMVLSTVAVAATGATVASGVFATSGASPTVARDLTGTVSAPATAAAAPQPQSGSGAASSADQDQGQAATGDVVALPELAPIAERSVRVSRSERRTAADPAKEAELAQVDGPAMTRTEDLSDDDPRTVGRALLAEFGWSSDQFGCLDSLWTKESGWNIYADNPSSSAYGIPQALPGSKMSSAGADWATNPVTQITWGLGYIRDRYGSPCGAWAHSVSNNWY